MGGTFPGFLPWSAPTIRANHRKCSLHLLDNLCQALVLVKCVVDMRREAYVQFPFQAFYWDFDAVVVV